VKKLRISTSGSPVATEQVGKPAKRAALITGASGGIGRAIAVALGALGWDVVVASRRQSAIDETAKLVDDAGGRAVALVVDLTDVASIDRMCAEAASRVGTLDVLVNNAGLAVPGFVWQTADEDHRRVVETNLLGTMLLTNRIVRTLVERKLAGDVVFMTSESTVQPRPQMASYAATKAGVEMYARTLALELEGSRVRSTIVRIGPTQPTGFADDWDPAIFEQLIPYWQRFGAQRHWGAMEPEHVANVVVHALTAPRGSRVAEIEVVPPAPAD
jgi:NADP-dependent 3-hydroxy acid dehydrogenase YdfG